MSNETRVVPVEAPKVLAWRAPGDPWHDGEPSANDMMFAWGHGIEIEYAYAAPPADVVVVAWRLLGKDGAGWEDFRTVAGRERHDFCQRNNQPIEYATQPAQDAILAEGKA